MNHEEISFQQPSVMNHIPFLGILVLSFIGINLRVSPRAIVDFTDLLFLIPLKVLPFLTFWFAYNEKIKKSIRKFINSIKNKSK